LASWTHTAKIVALTLRVRIRKTTEHSDITTGEDKSLFQGREEEVKRRPKKERIRKVMKVMEGL
jgi:hypothetical protein